MKTYLFFILSLLFIITNSQFLRFLQSSKNSYDYSSYTATSVNQNLNAQTLSSTTSDKSVVYITQSGITIQNSSLKKESGDSSKTENSEFYGVNAAVLVNGGDLTMTGGSITTSAKGANAVVATNNGNVKITGTQITSTASGSARGLHATFGGKIEADNVKISTKGNSCASLATDRGEGTVTCTDCELVTAGAGSPLIYSTGDITVSKSTGTATGAQIAVIEGKNKVTIKEASDLKCNANPNRKEVDTCGVMLYQSMSGDAASGTSVFNCDKSSLEIQSSSSYYKTAPMFFITNTQAQINLEECTFKYGSGVFLKAAGTSEWGSSGSNGGLVTLTLTNQDIEGDIVIDSVSGLTLNLISSTIKGKINNANTAAKLAITLDEDSQITLTGNSYYTSLVNEKSDGSNLINGTYKWTASTEKVISNSGNNGNSGNNRPPSNNRNNSTNARQPPNGEPPSDINGMPQPPSGSNRQPPNEAPSSDMNGMPQPPSGSNGQPPNGQPPNGQPPSDMNGMPQPPSGSNGQPPNGEPPSDMNGMPQPPSGSNGQPPNGAPSSDMNGPPDGQQPPNGDNGGQPNGAPNNNNGGDGDEDIGPYILNEGFGVMNYYYLTLMLIFVILG